MPSLEASSCPSSRHPELTLSRGSGWSGKKLLPRAVALTLSRLTEEMARLGAAMRGGRRECRLMASFHRKILLCPRPSKGGLHLPGGGVASDQMAGGAGPHSGDIPAHPTPGSRLPASSCPLLAGAGTAGRTGRARAAPGAGTPGRLAPAPPRPPTAPRALPDGTPSHVPNLEAPVLPPSGDGPPPVRVPSGEPLPMSCGREALPHQTPAGQEAPSAAPPDGRWVHTKGPRLSDSVLPVVSTPLPRLAQNPRWKADTRRTAPGALGPGTGHPSLPVQSESLGPDQSHFTDGQLRPGVRGEGPHSHSWGLVL